MRDPDSLAEALTADLEVLRMPAGSNPSYVTREQLRVLQRMCPDLATCTRSSGVGPDLR